LLASLTTLTLQHRPDLDYTRKETPLLMRQRSYQQKQLWRREFLFSHQREKNHRNLYFEPQALRIAPLYCEDLRQRSLVAKVLNLDRREIILLLVLQARGRPIALFFADYCRDRGELFCEF